MHLIADMDTVVYKACYAAERTVYDAIPARVQHFVDLEDYESYQRYLIKTFRYAKDFKAWKEEQAEPDAILRLSRKEVEPLSHSLHLINTQIREMMNNIQPEQVTLLISGSNNFRDKVAKVRPYKEDRKEREKPLYFEAVRQFLIEKWHAITVDGCEADDMCSIIAYASMEGAHHPYVVVHIDKDLNSIPGWHYDYDRKTWYWVTPWEGLQHFYTQLLAGDNTDCIPGLYKVGEEKAKKHLAKCKTEEGMFKKAQELYRQDKRALQDERGPDAVLVETARLVHMQQYVGEMWTPPL